MDIFLPPGARAGARAGTGGADGIGGADWLGGAPRRAASGGAASSGGPAAEAEAPAHETLGAGAQDPRWAWAAGREEARSARDWEDWLPPPPAHPRGGAEGGVGRRRAALGDAAPAVEMSEFFGGPDGRGRHGARAAEAEAALLALSEARGGRGAARRWAAGGSSEALGGWFGSCAQSPLLTGSSEGDAGGGGSSAGDAGAARDSGGAEAAGGRAAPEGALPAAPEGALPALSRTESAEEDGGRSG